MTVTVVLDDFALAAVPGLDAELARAGALVMRAFQNVPNPHLLRRYHAAAVVGGPDRAGLVARLERVTASVAAPVIGILPAGVLPSAELRGPGVVDLVPATAPGICQRILLMAMVPIVSVVRAPRSAEPLRGVPRAAARVGAADALAEAVPVGEPAEVLAIASSTGGVWVLAALLRELPGADRAVLVAQHMEAEFVPFFAEWLEGASGWRTVLVDAPVPLAPGVAYVAAGGKDLVLDGTLVRAAPATSRFVPSADRLLASASRLGARAAGLVLSGMGADGAAGLAEIARAGGSALCQAPATAVVPSMPECAPARTPGALALPPVALAAALGAHLRSRTGDAACHH
jgi:two-component system, chemotaxis family, protein-glutamate methylesterase/glutaminase